MPRDDAVRVTSLQVENLMTFGDFCLRLDGQRCTVVGPNGAGKSNIVRVIDLAQKALDSVSEGYGNPRYVAAGQVLRSYAVARHHGEPADRAIGVPLLPGTGGPTSGAGEAEGRDVKVKDVLRLIEQDGWYLVAQRGSHRQYRHRTKPGRVTVAGKPSADVPPGTLGSIVKQAGLRGH